MKRIRTVILSVTAFLSLAVLLPVRAQTSLLPNQIEDIFALLGEEGSGAAGFVTSRIQLALIIALGVVVLIAVVYSILAAIKYIQSQGDEGKIEEAQKAIQAIFFGIGALLIAIVGIVLVFVFFGANRVDPSLFQSCLSAPNSEGCRTCLDGADATDTGNACGACEAAYKKFAAGTVKRVPNRCQEPLSNN